MPLPPVEAVVYEYPLRAWRDVAGSKVRPRDGLKACFGLALIYWTYLRPQADPGQCVEPRHGRPRGHDRLRGEAEPYDEGEYGTMNDGSVECFLYGLAEI
jgi:hypothetical protein